MPGPVEINRFDRVTRGQFATQMAWALSYSPRMMAGEDRVIRKIAEVREGRRLSACSAASTVGPIRNEAGDNQTSNGATIMSTHTFIVLARSRSSRLRSPA